MFPTFWIKVVSFRYVGIFFVFRVVLLNKFIRNNTILLSLNFRVSFACWFYFVLIDTISSFWSLKKRQYVFDMAIGRWDINFLKIFYNFILSSFTNLTNFTVHKCSSNFITTLLAYLTFEKYIMIGTMDHEPHSSPVVWGGDGGGGRGR